MNLGARPEPPVPASAEDRTTELASTLEDLAAIFVITAASAEQVDAADPRSKDGFAALVDKRTTEHVRRALEKLPERERRILELHYFGEMSLTDAGKELGLSKSWTSRLHARAVRMMAEELAHLAED